MFVVLKQFLINFYMSFLGNLSDRDMEARRPVPHYKPSCLFSPDDDDWMTEEERTSNAIKIAQAFSGYYRWIFTIPNEDKGSS